VKNICVDAGNTLIKIALSEESAILSVVSFSCEDINGLMKYIGSLPKVDNCILSRVGFVNQAIIDALMLKSEHFMELTADTPIPFSNHYQTPETLGKDRLAAIAGAYSLFPDNDILVIDAGTALTIDFIDKNGNYLGGNISPGLNMRFKALHDYTEKLPLLSQTDEFQLLGKCTESAIVSGIQFGMIFEVNKYIDHFVKKNEHLVKILTGGDRFFLENKIEHSIFAEPNLVFIGLDYIIEFNRKR